MFQLSSAEPAKQKAHRFVDLIACLNSAEDYDQLGKQSSLTTKLSYVSIQNPRKQL